MFLFLPKSSKCGLNAAVTALETLHHKCGLTRAVVSKVINKRQLVLRSDLVVSWTALGSDKCWSMEAAETADLPRGGFLSELISGVVGLSSLHGDCPCQPFRALHFR